MRKKLWGIGLAAALGFALLAAVNLYPSPLFAHSRSFGAFTIYSDRPIDPALAQVVADAERRLRTSGALRPTDRFRVYLCNAPWRLLLFTRSAGLGAQTDTAATRNIYVREIDAASNRIVPRTGVLADPHHRPLSYYLAHEATHVIQSRRYGRLMLLRYPRWLIEGHADMVGKGGDFDFSANRALLRAGDPRLDYQASGLYRRYQLMVEALVRSGSDIDALFADPPPEREAMRAVWQS